MTVVLLRPRPYDLGFNTIGRAWTWVMISLVLAIFHQTFGRSLASTNQELAEVVQPLALSLTSPACTLGSFVLEVS